MSSRAWTGIPGRADDEKVASQLRKINTQLYDVSRALSTEADPSEGPVSMLTDPSYVVIALSGDLTNERKLTAGSGITITDGGANGNATVAASLTGFAVPALTFDTTNAAGAATTGIRSDAQIALFDATIPAVLATAGAAGSAGVAARRDHVHEWPTTLQSDNASTTLALTDDGTDQTLTGNTGDLTLVSTNGRLGFDSNEPQGNGVAAFLLQDQEGEGDTTDRTTGFYLRVVNREGVGSFSAKETAMSLTGQSLPQLCLHQPGVDRIGSVTATGFNFRAQVNGTTGYPQNPTFSLTTTGASPVEFTQTSLQGTKFINASTTSGAYIAFQCASVEALNSQIRFEHTYGTKASADSAALFLFKKTSAFGGSSTANLLETEVAGTTGFRFNQSQQPGMLDASAAFFVNLAFNSSVTALTADRTLTVNMQNADRTIRLNGNPVLDDWFNQSVKSVDNVTFNDVEIDGALNHDGSAIGFFGVVPAFQKGPYTITNETTDRTFDANSTSVAELADVLATLINDLTGYGIFTT